MPRRGRRKTDRCLRHQTCSSRTFCMCSMCTAGIMLGCFSQCFLHLLKTLTGFLIWDRGLIAGCCFGQPVDGSGSGIAMAMGPGTEPCAIHSPHEEHVPGSCTAPCPKQTTVHGQTLSCLLIPQAWLKETSTRLSMWWKVETEAGEPETSLPAQAGRSAQTRNPNPLSLPVAASGCIDSG